MRAISEIGTPDTLYRSTNYWNKHVETVALDSTTHFVRFYSDARETVLVLYFFLLFSFLLFSPLSFLLFLFFSFSSWISSVSNIPPPTVTLLIFFHLKVIIGIVIIWIQLNDFEIKVTNFCFGQSEDLKKNSLFLQSKFQQYFTQSISEQRFGEFS